MVKIPKLTEDGQNWKIYRAKFLEVAATFDCLEVLAGRPYEGEDWDGCNALLCCTFMESVPPSIYFKIRCRTAHENFKYLAKRFRNSEPIPCANELQCAGTATAVETPENYPTSANAATEQHANAKRDEEDLSTTQDLTQGTEDVDNRNVGCQDPRTSLEASAQGTSAKCIEMTPVNLESTPHELQDQPQDSLQVTPYACEQEVADSVVTAGHTNGTAKMAKPNVADINGKAALGRDLLNINYCCGLFTDYISTRAHYNMSHRDGAGTYLGAGGTKCLVLEPNGFRDHADGLNACTDAHSIGNGMETPAHETESVSMH